jgi:hypothetical protein
MIDVTGKYISFVRCMTESGLAGDDWWYMLEKQWKWDDEYAIWLKYGEPTDATDPMFDTFMDRIESL